MFLKNVLFENILNSSFFFNNQDEIKRDYAYGVKDQELRRVKLLPWFPDDCTDIDNIPVEPDESYFMVTNGFIFDLSTKKTKTILGFFGFVFGNEAL
jgi:hypothetical protein